VTSSRSSAAPAVLFDVDGTLVDSNYLHVHAWQRAFSEAGIAVPAWRIHRCIGMDGSTLVSTLYDQALSDQAVSDQVVSDQVVSDQATDDVQHRLKELHTKYYRESAALLAPLPGARELLRSVADLGLQVVLATSAPEDELALLRRVLDTEEVFSAVTSSEDVDTAKPEPDIVQVALERAGVDVDRAVFVGDAVWDVEACVRADLPCIGLLSGGVSRDELETTGAIAVFEDAADLRTHLAASRIGALAAATS
jgi:HAD superfamily hydrolase (TIGR01509 family)